MKFNSILILMVMFSSLVHAKVVVVGAGLAGLTAAYRLMQQGIDVEVYEARARAGGRVLTAHFGSSYEELGGKNLLDGGEPENILPLIQELGLKIVDFPGIWKFPMVINGEIFPYVEIFKGAKPPSDELFEFLTSKAQTANNLGEIADEFLSGQPLLRALMEMMMRGWNGPSSYEMSAGFAVLSFWDLYCFNWDVYLAGDKGFFRLQQYVEGGNSCLIDALTSKLGSRIHYSSPLRGLKKNKKGKIGLEFDSTSVVADTVILALPCSCLRDVEIEEGLIPQDQMHAIQTLQYGTTAKLLFPIHIDHPECYPASCITEHTITWTNQNSSVMTWYMPNPEGDSALIISREMPSIKKIYPTLKVLSDPVGVRWQDEEFSKGSYSSFGRQLELFEEEIIDGGERVRKVFRSIDNQIFFAGEHTAFEEPGTMEGAVQSGNRAARMILRGKQ